MINIELLVMVHLSLSFRNCFLPLEDSFLSAAGALDSLHAFSFSPSVLRRESNTKILITFV
jgi:hypothetical protein